MIIDLR